MQPAAQDVRGGIRTAEVSHATNAHRRRRESVFHDHVGQAQKQEVLLRRGRVAVYPGLRVIQPIRQDPAPIDDTINVRLNVRAAVVVWRPTGGSTQTLSERLNVMREGKQGAVRHGQQQHLS